MSLLIDSSNKINRTEFPAVNDVAAWARLESGDPEMVKFHNYAVDAADQFAKIMSGGGSGNATSDAKIKQGLDMFRTGFTKNQVLASATSVQDMLNNRKRELIGDNRYLTQWYGGAGGQNRPAPAQKALSIAQIQQAAKDNGVSVDEATRQAKAAGYNVQ